ncbi:hypothetical protein K1X76_07700 [bacterium]|nr:hypothetical protein [bacterium]
MNKLVLLFFILLLGVTSSQAQTPQELQCYMPYRNTMMLYGCEIEGYSIKPDIAQQAGVLMLLLPTNTPNFENTPVFFIANTLPLNGKNYDQIFEEDLKSITLSQSTTKVVSNNLQDKPQTIGPCRGGELQLKDTPFPYERYYICEAKSKTEALQLQIQARTLKDLENHFANFLKWTDTHHIKDSVFINNTKS